MYPGKPDGTVSQRIAHAITTEIIEKADYLLDLHCGDGNDQPRPDVYQHVTANPQLDRAIERLVLAFGIDHVVVDRDVPPTRRNPSTARRRPSPAASSP